LIIGGASSGPSPSGVNFSLWSQVIED